MKFNQYIILLFAIIILGCKAQVNSKKSSIPSPSIDTITINGNGMLGAVEGATVKAYALNTNGSFDLSLPLATSVTDDLGNYYLQFSSKKIKVNSPIAIQLTGGSYREEANGKLVSLNGKKLTSLVSSTKAGTYNSVAIGPLSEMAYKVFQANLAKPNANLISISEHAKNANAQIGNAFGLTDIVSILPASPIGKIPNNNHGQYTVVLFALSNIAQNAGTDSVAIGEAYSKHFILNGNLDNIGNSPMNVSDSTGKSVSVTPPTPQIFSSLVSKIGSGVSPMPGLITDPSFNAPVIKTPNVNVPTVTAITTQSCVVANGLGSQTWNGSAWSNCNIISCNSNFTNKNNSCSPNSSNCTVVNGTGLQLWNGVTWGACKIATCNENYANVGNSCLPNTKYCTSGNIPGTQTWNGSSWGTCIINTCSANYSKINNSCVPNTQACSVANGTGTQSWNGTSWNICATSSCNTYYTKVGTNCVADSQVCSITNGVGSQTWNGANWSTCAVKSCNLNFSNINNTCLPNAQSCTVLNGTGSQNRMGSSFGPCNVTSCNSNYTLSNNSCVSNNLSCAIENGQGSQSFNGTALGACTVVTCNTSFHLSNNTCVYNVQGCNLPNAISAMQSWNGSSWGNCTVIEEAKSIISSVSANTDNKQLWITPPGKQLIELNKFLDISYISEWQKSFNAITGTKFYMVNLDKNHPTYIGDQGVQNLIKYAAYSKSKGKKIAFELGALYSETCDTGPFASDGMPQFATRGFDYEGGILKQLKNSNINIDSIVLDGPFIRIFDSAYSSCVKKFGTRLTVEFVADQLIKYMGQMRVLFPNVDFVLLSNYPNWNSFGISSLNTVGDRIVDSNNRPISYNDVLSVVANRAFNQGVPFSSLQIDHPYNYLIYNNGIKSNGTISTIETNTRWLRIKKLVDLAASLNIPSNIIINSEVDEVSAQSSIDFTNQTLKYLDEVKSNSLNINAISVQSWYSVPSKIIPENLNSSFTNIVFQAGVKLGLITNSITSSTAATSTGVFNESCYLARYPDVQTGWVAGGGTALNHWLINGKNEGRIPGCDAGSAPINTAPIVSNIFNEACYLARYPDVASIWIGGGGKAIDHWNLHGKAEGRIAGCDTNSANEIVVPVVNTPAITSGNNFSISNNVFGSPLVISTSQRFAGAIESLTWNGQEFINRDDHGRELQSASSFDGLGECYNPTEAGSDRDGPQNFTTSKLLGISAAGNQLKTTVQMAFWTYANAPYPAGCGGLQTYHSAQNKTDLSTDLLSKQVTIGFQGMENVIEYLVSFKVTANHSSATFEALTGYMGVNFSAFWTFDPSTSQVKTLSRDMGEQSLPVILSTQDKNYAMGIYAPDLPQATFPSVGYGRFDFAQYNTMKWNAVFRNGNTPIGNYDFRTYVIVGNLSQVAQAMAKLHHYFNPNSNPTPVVVTQNPIPTNTPTPAPLPYVGNAGLSPYVFDASWYLNNNADLKALNFTISQATQHWVDFGIKEGRKGHPNFNSRSYLNRYPDLQSVFGSGNYEAAIKHFVEFGRLENRSGAD